MNKRIKREIITFGYQQYMALIKCRKSSLLYMLGIVNVVTKDDQPRFNTATAISGRG